MNNKSYVFQSFPTTTTTLQPQRCLDWHRCLAWCCVGRRGPFLDLVGTAARIVHHVRKELGHIHRVLQLRERSRKGRDKEMVGVKFHKDPDWCLGWVIVDIMSWEMCGGCFSNSGRLAPKHRKSNEQNMFRKTHVSSSISTQKTFMAGGQQCTFAKLNRLVLAQFRFWTVCT